MCSCVWDDNFCVVWLVFKDLIEEAGKKDDMMLGTSKGCNKHFFSEDEFRMLGCMMNRQGKTFDAVEDQMQSAHKVFFEHIMMYKSKDVPWKIKEPKTGGPCLCRLFFGK